MLELKNEGLYIANGKEISVLIKVVGKAPMLDIACGVLLNDMNNKNVVTVLDKNSPEIQDIINNPSAYIYDYPCVSDIVKNEEGLKSREKKLVEYTEKQFSKWVDKYQKFKKEDPDKCDNNMTIFLAMNDNFSVNQAQMIIKQINSRLRVQMHERSQIV